MTKDNLLGKVIFFIIGAVYVLTGAILAQVSIGVVYLLVWVLDRIHL